MSTPVDGRRGRPLALVLVASVLAIAAFANAAIYIAHAGNPLVASDSWYFIEAFLRKAMESGPTLQDFFVNRGAMDHAQPLVKALLLLDAQWWGLDFVYEALVGLALAAATFAVLAATTWRGARERQPRWLHGLLLGTMAACLVTLNSGMVFSWSLVTLIFISYLEAVCGAACAWRALRTGRPGALFAAMLVIAFTMDDVGILMAAAIAIATLLASARLRAWRSGLLAVAAIVLAEGLYAAVSAGFLHPGNGAVSRVVGGSHLQVAWELRGSALEIMRIVFGSSLAHANPVDYYFPGQVAGIQSGLALAAVAAHAWFWWRAWRGEWNRAVFHAVALMLLFYSLVAGIVYARVPEYGAAYLNEPRYVAIYLLSSVALLLMVLGQQARLARPAWRILALVLLLALLALQVALSRFTWYEGRFLGRYYHEMAHEMLVLGEGQVPAACVPMLSVCEMPPAQRDEAIRFLRRHGLNVYSPEFLARYRFEALQPVPGDDRP